MSVFYLDLLLKHSSFLPAFIRTGSLKYLGYYIYNKLLLKRIYVTHGAKILLEIV